VYEGVNAVGGTGQTEGLLNVEEALRGFVPIEAFSRRRVPRLDDRHTPRTIANSRLRVRTTTKHVVELCDGICCSRWSYGAAGLCEGGHAGGLQL
jgi:hypothetical protein